MSGQHAMQRQIAGYIEENEYCADYNDSSLFKDNATAY